jgi:hypothetical protein
MAVDVIDKIIDANDVEIGQIVIAVTKFGSYQRVDGDDELGSSDFETVAYNKLNGRFDNPTYYTS